MEAEKVIKSTTLLLCFVAGFCDSVTFIAAGELFSAHVTGNFIVFAYDVVKHSDARGWQKLLSFPVFVSAAMLGGHIGKKFGNTYLLLILEGIFLLLSGFLSALLVPHSPASGWLTQLIAMLIVTAMAFQNTFGKLNPKATYGLTTVMTGNVTQAALDLMKIVSNEQEDRDIWYSFKRNCYLIIGFLTGCLGGAILAMQFGVIAVILPGSLVLFWLWRINPNVP
ncbi:YoaK family protein [Mucilaginibacter auburnensis]|uniref:Uncharacterized membrane protein YoaK (UPF0700 family) n=1 Tax=Mucilaginibacter auburnensis TaxID=1457233 RepID=A0A2H9VW37_9SPHI|nr:YoaK family protein [Mucilaginibacter auburnensis]PJJ85030.1 uncharacterized membrane protein YoaK (UPF0700 family) [Mucilaginibacter auburnensis]